MIPSTVVHHALRRIFRMPSSSLDAMASRVWEHSPAGIETVPPILLLPGSLERVVSGPQFLGARRIPREEVTPDALGGVRHLAPTKIYEIRDAIVSRGSVFARGHRYTLRAAPLRESIWGSLETIDEAALVGSPWGSNFFGHWIMEDCAQQLLAETFGGALIDIKRPTYRHEPGYRELLELRPPRQVDGAHIRKLTVIVDAGPTVDKRKRIATLRHRLQENLGNLPIAETRGVFVARGTTGALRSLLNQDAVIERLRQRGFGILDPETLTAREVAAGLMTAAFVIGVDGSHLAPHVLATRPGTCVIEMHAANRFYPAHRLYLNAFDVKYAILVCPHRSETEFEVNLDELERLLDICEVNDSAPVSGADSRPS